MLQVTPSPHGGRAHPSADVGPDATRPLAGRDLAALTALVVGSLVLPVVGWLVGLGLLWTSRTWTAGEKLLATLVWPGGLLPPLALPLLPGSVGLLRSPALAMTVVSLLVIAPLAVAGVLLRRAQGRTGD